MCSSSFGQKFCSENRKYLLEFLKVAEDRKTSQFCDTQEHNSLKDIYPLDEELKKELKDYIAHNSIIDITEDEQIEKEVDNVYEELKISKDISYVNQSTVEDITHSLKEQLETKKYLSEDVLRDLNDSQNIQNIFALLSEELNIEEVINFGLSIQDADNNENTVVYYVRFLLVKKLSVEYSEQLQTTLNQFSVSYSDIVLDELVTALLTAKNQKIFLQFIDRLNVDVKTKLFRRFIFSCETFQEHNIPIAEILITSQIEYNTLNKLVDLFSNSIDNFITDKAFGKLLVNVVQLLGRSVVSLEQPLKHIIGSHKSIWKSKIQKAFDDCLQDSSLSQSFR